MSSGDSTRRELLKFGLASGATSLMGWPVAWADCAGQYPTAMPVPQTGCGAGLEAMPYSPLILEPWKDDLPVPRALNPGWRRPDGSLDPNAQDAWTVRQSRFGAGVVPPGPQPSHQDAIGDRPNGAGLPPAGTHQLWPGSGVLAAYPVPIVYHMRLQVAEHQFTSSKVRPIGILRAPRGKTPTIGEVPGPDGSLGKQWALPKSTIYGFNGTFPGPLINSEYGRPVCVRFENDLDVNERCLDRQDFGAPDWAFLTHLHNGHTAPESDGNPFHLTDNHGGYLPGQWSDNLYPMYPAGGDEREKQSFLWFHDHRMHHTGANVYKGLVGLMPHYDPILDSGDERTGLRLPGVRSNNSDGTFDVDYDIPLALYDVALDDGRTPHYDNHTPLAVCGQTHLEWWGKHFFRHYTDHGFVGDIFTVNGKAFPVFRVKRRKYRLRFLDASVSRIYELSLMQGTIAPVPGQQGQWNFGTTDRRGGFKRSRGQQCMRLTQIASEGGLLATPIVRDSFQLWPAKRREFVVDFSRYMDGSSTSNGDVIYLANTMLMRDGRKPDFPGDRGFDPNYCVPMLKIIIDGDAADASLMPQPGQLLRPMPDRDTPVTASPRFVLDKAGATEEGLWVINGLEFNPLAALHTVRRDAAEEWTIVNAGGGWVHPMHMHNEEHQVVSRVGGVNPHPEDGPPAIGKEDVVALDGGEQVTFYRRFRTFTGKYVSHCHNLAHEDHNMMFGWTIIP